MIRTRKGFLPVGILCINPEFERLIPPLSEQEFGQLKANIYKEGMREPLVVWRLFILDGHNRYKIITDGNFTLSAPGGRPNTFRDGYSEVPVLILDLPGEEAAKLWIQENQLGRRNLTDAYRVKMATDVYEARIKASREQAAAKARTEKAAQVGKAATRYERRLRAEEKKVNRAAVAGKTLATKKQNTLAEVAKLSGVSQQDIRDEHRRREESSAQPAASPVRKTESNFKFLPHLKPGDGLVVIWEVHKHGAEGGRSVERVISLTAKTITAGRDYFQTVVRRDSSKHYETVEGQLVERHTKTWKFERATGKSIDKRLPCHIVRIASDDDRQADEKGRAVHAATQERFEAALGQLRPSGHIVSDQRFPAGEIGLQLRALTVEQLEQIVEALQPAPALAGR